MTEAANGSVSGVTLLPEKPIDERLKEADLVLKAADAALKSADLKARSGWRKYLSSPLAPIIVTAFAGFVVSQITSYIQTRDNLALEREKLKSSLFLKMIETGNSEASAKNLLFLLDIGLIDDPNGKISALRKIRRTLLCYPAHQVRSCLAALPT